MPETRGHLEQARCSLGLSLDDLWMRCFALGAMATSLELEAYLFEALVPPPHEHDLIAVALNERFTELGGDHPVPYQADETRR